VQQTVQKAGFPERLVYLCGRKEKTGSIQISNLHFDFVEELFVYSCSGADWSD